MMQSFVQYTPTKVVFGKDTQKEAGKLVSELGITKVFLVYGGGSVIRSGLLDEIKKSLDEEHISYEEFGGVNRIRVCPLQEKELKKRLLLEQS